MWPTLWVNLKKLRANANPHVKFQTLVVNVNSLHGFVFLLNHNFLCIFISYYQCVLKFSFSKATPFCRGAKDSKLTWTICQLLSHQRPFLKTTGLKLQLQEHKTATLTVAPCLLLECGTGNICSCAFKKSNSILSYTYNNIPFLLHIMYVCLAQSHVKR